VILYAAVMAGLLFLALAFFTAAQAGAVRNGGQSAADAAALAAAQDDRDQLVRGLLDDLGHSDSDSHGTGDSHGGEWRDWLRGRGTYDPAGCGPAADFAGRNHADLRSCRPITHDGDDGYAVRVETRNDTGHTLVPGASHRHAYASATAVLRPRCTPDDDEGDGENGGGAVRLSCHGEEVTLDPHGHPDDPDLDPSDLFTAVLVD
jgi:hypothetical protein